jgi:hypothetical protein
MKYSEPGLTSCFCRLPSAQHLRAQGPNGGRQANEECARHYGEADVQLFHLRQRGYAPHIGVVEAVAGVNAQAELPGRSGRRAQGEELTHEGGASFGVGVTPGVQLDGVGADVTCSEQRLFIRIDEERDADTGALERLDGGGDGVAIAGHIQAALCRELFALFRDEADLVRLERAGKCDHLFRAGHLEIEVDGDGLMDQLYIPVLDVTAILAQVDRDLVRSTEYGGVRGCDDFGETLTTGLANCGYVIDVDT